MDKKLFSAQNFTKDDEPNSATQYIILIKQIEEAKIELQCKMDEARATLWKENKDFYHWLAEVLNDLRKERINFQKKSLTDIYQSLKECGVDDQLITKWLEDIHQYYHNDLSIAQKMLSIDLETLDKSLFTKFKDEIEAKIVKNIDTIL